MGETFGATDSTNGVATEKENEMNTNRNQITIGLGNSSYWLSIVEVRGDKGWSGTKEMALVCRNDTSFMGIDIVPLQDWFDSSEYDDVIDLANCSNKRYHLLDGAGEAEVIAEAIIRAKKMVDRVTKGFHFVTEPNSEGSSVA